MPIWSASNSCSREKRAIESFERASTSSWACVGEHLRIDPREQRGRLFELGPLGRMARGDMRDFMRHDGRDFRRVVGKSKQAARDENISRGQREGVDDRRIEYGDAVLRSGAVRGRPDLHQNAVEIGLGRRRSNRHRQTRRSAACVPDWAFRPKRGAARGSARGRRARAADRSTRKPLSPAPIRPRARSERAAPRQDARLRPRLSGWPLMDAASLLLARRRDAQFLSSPDRRPQFSD